MTELERVYKVPLRKGAMKAPQYMRANKAVRVLREFLQRHMKSEDVRIGPYLNSKILEHGRKNIPHHVDVKVVKDKEGIVRAEYEHSKDLSFLKPIKEDKKDEINIKIPGLGKKKDITEKEKVIEGITEKEKKEILEHPPEKKIPHTPSPEHIIDKAVEVKTKESQVYGRLGSKKTKVKEKKA